MKTKPAAKCLPLLILPSATTKAVVEEARSAGYFPILCDEPEKVRVVVSAGIFTPDDLLLSALHGLCQNSVSSSERSSMVLDLNRRVCARLAK